MTNRPECVVVPKSEEKCNRGSNFQEIEKIEGRHSDGLVTMSWVILSSGPLVNHIESSFLIRNYQIIQVAPDRVVLKTPTETQELVVENICEFVKSQIGSDIKITLEWMDKDTFPIKH